MQYRTVIGIDPGNITGIAVFCDRMLQAAATFKQDALTNDDTIEVCFRSAGFAPAIVVVEVPRIYPHGGKGDQNDLIDLAVLAGDLLGMYRRLGFHTRIVYPRQWKGSVPKNIHNKRVLAMLGPRELALLPERTRAKQKYDHNMLDAVGIGLFQLKRM